MAKKLLEQWQDRAFEAEARIKQAIAILRHSSAKPSASVEEALNVLEKGAIEEPKFNTEGTRTGRMPSDKENVAGVSKGPPWKQKAKKPAKKSARGTDRNAM